MPCAAEEQILASPRGKGDFSLAAGLAVLETHDGENAARGKKSHQGIFSNKRTIAVGPTRVKWQKTHQHSGPTWWDTAVGSGETFKYDPFGRRVQKSSPSGTVNYLYDVGNVIEELDSSGNLLARYTGTQNTDEPLSELRSGTASYYEQDGLNSVTSLSSSSGALANTYIYDSFGKTTAFTGILTNPLQYSGREADVETGIYEYRARYYSQSTGRFISEDPSEFRAGLNFYKYVSNDPLNLIDPTGLSAQGAWGGMGDLICYAIGSLYCNRYHGSDAVAADLASTPAMNDIRDKYKAAHCASGTYCGAFGPKQVLTTWNFVGQTVGGFCARMTNLGYGDTQVDIHNVWGAASGTRNPTANRNNPSVWDMLVHGASITNPSSLWNDWYGGPLGHMTFAYGWMEKTPCCGN